MTGDSEPGPDFHALVMAEISDLEQSDAGTEQDRAPIVLDQQSVGRLSRMDALQKQAMDAASHQRRTQRIRLLKGALARLEDGEYGFCETCGEAIAEARLVADPAARMCIGCARNHH